MTDEQNGSSAFEAVDASQIDHVIGGAGVMSAVGGYAKNLAKQTGKGALGGCVALGAIGGIVGAFEGKGVAPLYIPGGCIVGAMGGAAVGLAYGSVGGGMK